MKKKNLLALHLFMVVAFSFKLNTEYAIVWLELPFIVWNICIILMQYERKQK